MVKQRVPNQTKQTPNRDVNAANRVAMAIKLRAQKLTYEEIARQCGYSGASVCRKAILRELDRCVVKNVDELRTQELSMLDHIHAEIYPMIFDHENKGRLFAVDRVLALADHRAKLLGLYTPTGTNVAAAQVIIREMPHGYMSLPTPAQEQRV
jgi:hypothetical protein